MKHYETELPENYVEAKTVDAKNRKTAVLFNVIAISISIVVFVAIWMILFKLEPVKTSWQRLLVDDYWKMLLRLVIFLVIYIAYIILHELTHGIVYKAFTKQKLTFGLTLSVAYCGVPNIYVYRTASICALVAPFAVFDVVFLVPMFFLKQYAYLVMCAAMLATHIGGCVGDLYDLGLYAFVFRDKRTLMRDTGPKQTFYVPSESKLGQKIGEKNCLSQSQNDVKSDAKE